MDKINIFDTTLRDGEQAPGNTMFDWEKIEIADALANSGVDVIEAGFPSASQGDFDSVGKVSKFLVDEYREKSPIITGLARANEGDISRAGEAIEYASRIGKGRIHTFIASSEIHADRKLRKTQKEILGMAVNAVTFAKSYTNNIEFSPEDASRTGIEFLLGISEAAAKAGARTINIPDTVGYAVPEEYGEMIKSVHEAVSKYGSTVSVHCHNDLGRAVDNSLAGLINGARQVECAINGIGERAGNASLEQIIMNLTLRKDYYNKKGIYTDFNPEMIGELSRLVSIATGSWPSPNTPIVGTNAFAHQAGIHQDGVSKSLNTYEIMSPEEVGWEGERYVIGKHSGKSGIEQYLSEIGYRGFEKDVEKIRAEIKSVADKQKHVFDDDARAIMKNFGYNPIKPIIEFDKNETVYTRVVKPEVKMNMSWEDIETIVKGDGNGPIDAAYRAIKEYVGNGVELKSFRINAIGKGENAMAGARVAIERGGKTYIARGGFEDTVIAGISAYINALNRSFVNS